MSASSPSGIARASARAAIECSNQKMDPSCTECIDIPPVRAVILYPNLGTPMVLPPSETKLNFFIAAEGKSRALFGVTPHSKAFPQPAVLGYMFVDKHLRVYPISEKKLSEDTKDGRLWNDGKICDTAFGHVKVWCLGALADGTITDIDGKIVANIRKSTIDGFNNTAPAHPDDEDPLVDNPPLEWIYQIQIDLAALPNAPAPGKIVSLAWMMQLPTGYKAQTALAGMSDWEYQDKLIYDFLEAQKKSPQSLHVPDLYEFDVASALTNKLPNLKKTAPRRLKAWHPVSIGKNATLKIGHLSDVHVNSRHFVLANADAAIIEGHSDKLGPKVDNCFMSLKELFDNMKASGADAIFLTGDLLDFNRNLDPREVKGSSPKDQWPQYDLAKKLRDPKLYPRGIDDMLIFSLLRYSYEKLGLPVYITTGNHEAYDTPYGISPRMNRSVIDAVLDQIANDKSVVIPKALTAPGRYQAYMAKYADDFGKKAVAAAEAAADKAGEYYGAAEKKAAALYETASKQASAYSEAAQRKARELADAAAKRAAELAEAGKKKAGELYDAAGRRVDQARDAAGRMADATSRKAGELSDRMKTIPYIGPHWESATNTADDLLERAKKYMHSGVDRIGGLREPLRNAAQQVRSGISETAGKIKDDVAETAGRIQDGATQAAGKVREGAGVVAGRVQQGATAAASKIESGANTATAAIGELATKTAREVEALRDKAAEMAHFTKDPNARDVLFAALKMNEGIPADHNLTIYESCLIMGPSFPQVPKPFNFTPGNFDWFFTLFTPLADFRIDYNKQVLLGLDWGDSEIMVNADISAGELGAWATTWNDSLGGHMMGLPRADKSLNGQQRSLVTQVTASGKKVMLFTHFTLINYDMPVRLGQESSKFAASDNVFNAYTKGTFSKGRDFLYAQINKGIHYTLSGHSHRSGAYLLNNSDIGKMYSQGFQPAIFGDANKVAAQNHQTLFKSSSTTRVVVSSCGGPIGVQNLNGEMYGWNLMPPSGTLVNIDISGPKELQRVIAKKYKPAKPRFCVALDYIQTHAQFQVISWIPGFTKGNFWIVARNIPFATNFIESVDIYVGDANRHGFSKYSMQVKPQGFNHVYDASFADVDDFCDDALDADEKGKILFAEVRFNKALAGVSYYKQYNFDDAWIFRIVVEKNALGRLLIRPAEKDQAEFPDYGWLNKFDGARYPGGRTAAFSK